jgi:hypothetical protein
VLDLQHPPGGLLGELGGGGADLGAQRLGQRLAQGQRAGAARLGGFAGGEIDFGPAGPDDLAAEREAIDPPANVVAQQRVEGLRAEQAQLVVVGVRPLAVGVTEDGDLGAALSIDELADVAQVSRTRRQDEGPSGVEAHAGERLHRGVLLREDLAPGSTRPATPGPRRR